MRQSAEKGYAYGQFTYAQVLSRGLGVPADAAASVQWLQRAAQAGSEEARQQLKQMGLGSP